MINEVVRSKLPYDALVFDNYAYDNSIIGVSLDGRVIYCFEMMIEELMEEDGISYEEAIEWIEYNTLRSLPYAGEKAPMVVYIERY